MATGNAVPGAPATAEHTDAGRPVIDERLAAAPDEADAADAADAAASHRPGIPGAANPGAANPGAANPGMAVGRRPAIGVAPAADDDVPAGQRSARPWAGAGGRWLVWVFRAVLWTVLLLIGYRGIAAIATGQPVTAGRPVAGTAAARPAGGAAFPVSLARAYALEFGQVYLNFNAATAQQRAASLAAFLPPGTSPEFGWNGAGTQALESDQVAGVRVLGAHRAIVTLLARVNGSLLELAVPLYASGGGLVVSGQPALLARPMQVVPPAPASVPGDAAAKLALARMLPGFFRAYASGDTLRLSHFVAGGHPPAGLGGMVTFAGIRRMIVPAASGPVRRIIVTVTWHTAARPAHPGSASTGPAAAPAPGASNSPAAASPRTSTSPRAGTSPGSGSTKASPGGKASPSPGASPPRTSPPRVPAVDMSYALTVVRQGGRWLVRSIGAAVVQPWASP